MPRLAVILPARNAEAFIGIAVRSTLQSMPSDSVLHVMNDASTDGTLSKLDEITDARLRVTNKRTVTPGLAAVLNELLSVTDSEYVARMDADDITLPWRFRHQASFMRRRQLDLVFSPVVTFGKRVPIAPQRPEGLDPESFRRALLLVNPVAHSTMFGRRIAIDDAGGYRNVRSEDYDLWIRAATRESRLARTALPALLYRRHTAQVTNNVDWIKATADEPELRQSHARLSEDVLGLRLESLVGLRAPRKADAVAKAEVLNLIKALRGDLGAMPRAGARQVNRMCVSAEQKLE